MSFRMPKSFLIGMLLAILSAGRAVAQSPSGSIPVRIISEEVQRTGQNEVHMSMKVANLSDRTVFLTGIDYKSGPTPFPVFLEQWRAKEGWKMIAPCMDMGPPSVIKLNARKTMNLRFVLKVPLSSVCKERDIRLEGKFRYRLDYFDSEAQAQWYVNKVNSQGYEPAHAGIAVSEPFEIPPPHDP